MSKTPEEDNPYKISEDPKMYESRPHSSARKAKPGSRELQPEQTTRIERASRLGRQAETQPPLTTHYPVKHLGPGGRSRSIRNDQESTKIPMIRSSRRHGKVKRTLFGRLALAALTVTGLGIGGYEAYAIYQANQNNTIPIYGTPGITTIDMPTATATPEMDLNNFPQTTFDGMNGYAIPLDKQKVSMEQGYQTIIFDVKVQKGQTFALALAGGYQQVGVVGGDMQQLQDAMHNTWYPQEDKSTDPIIPDIVIISNDTDHELNYAWAIRLKSGGDWDNTQIRAWLLNGISPSKIGIQGSLIPAIENIQTTEKLTPFDPSDGIKIVDQRASTMIK